MDGGNAWELAEEIVSDQPGECAAEGSKPVHASASFPGTGGAPFQRQFSRSPSKASKLSELALNIEDIDIEAVHQQILEEQAEADRKKRSKSPALQTIRNLSQQILKRIGMGPKKQRDQLLFKHREIPEIKLDTVCIRPHEWVQKERYFDFRTMQSYTLDDPPAPKTQESDADEGAYENKIDQDELMRERGPHDYDPYCPVHGSRRRLTKGKGLIAVQSLLGKYEEAEGAGESLFLYSNEFIAKCIRKQKRAARSGAERIRTEKILRKIRSNLFIISFAFLFLFTAFHGLQNLQTSVNGELGADSLIVLYISLAFSSLVVPSFMISRIGCKLTLIVSICVYILYHFVNFLPRHYSLIPVSILTGVAGSCLWGAKCVYITECGIRYAQLNFEGETTVIVRFFGYFFMILHLGQVIGNLLSSLIFTAAMQEKSFQDTIDQTCGRGFPWNETELSAQAADFLTRPPSSVFIAVCAAYLCCAIVAVMIVAMFLNALHVDTINRAKPPSFSAQVLKLSWKNLRNVKMLLLVPLTLFNGIEQAFLVGVFTKAFVGCGLGISQIGFVMTAFGVSDAVCSLVFGPLFKFFGRQPLFVFGAVLNILMILALGSWGLNPADTIVFYVMAGAWGMADAVWNTQINGIWVYVTGRQSMEFAFASYRFWESLGIAMGFILTRLVSVQYFLLIAFSLLLIGIAGYFACELYETITAYMHTLCFVCLSSEKKGVPGAIPNSMQTSLISRSTIHGANFTR